MSEAVVAQEAFNGQILDEHKVKISFAKQKFGSTEKKPKKRTYTEDSDSNPPSCKLLIRDLAYNTTEESLKKLFHDAVSAQIAMDRETKTSRG